MRAPAAWIAGTACAALLAGCGGGGSDAGGPPKPDEPLAAAAHRLERAVARRDCPALAKLMLHSVVRGPGVARDAPPTARECRYLSFEARGSLNGLRVRKVREYGPAGLTEGTGRSTGRGRVVAVLWALDTDGSWKAVFDAVFREQLGFPSRAAALDTNARGFVTSVAKRNCNDLWRGLNVASRFVRGARGDRASFCRGIAATYRTKQGGIADIAADPGARPKRLAALRDIGFYGLELESGRYLVLTLTGRLGGFGPLREQRAHVDPSVVEIVTARAPKSG